MKVRLTDVVRECVAAKDVADFLFSTAEEIRTRWPDVWAKIENEAKRRACDIAQMVESAKVAAHGIRCNAEAIADAVADVSPVLNFKAAYSPEPAQLPKTRKALKATKKSRGKK